MRFILGFLAFIAAIIVVAMLTLGGGLWTYVTAPFFGAVQAEKTLESGPSRIALYNRFHNKCAGVQSIEGQIDAQSALLASLDKTSPEYVRALQNVAGLKSRRAQVIAQYNADASKDYTSARFLDADLPYQLSTAEYAGTKTACAR